MERVKCLKRIVQILLCLALCFSMEYGKAEVGISIGYGDTGDMVVAIQRELIDQGFLKGKADGKFGRQTENAVKEMQTRYGLQVTGRLDTTSYYILCSDEREAFGKYEQYDDLQMLYLCLRADLTYPETLNIVERYGLPYTDQKYNEGRTIKVAYTQGAARQRHAESGDHVEIHFDENEYGTYDVSVIEYFNSSAFVTLFEYVSGTYWDFRDDCAYKGYYINDYFGDDGIVIVHDNGRSCQTDYHLMNSKIEQFEVLNQKLTSKD